MLSPDARFIASDGFIFRHEDHPGGGVWTDGDHEFPCRPDAPNTIGGPHWPQTESGPLWGVMLLDKGTAVSFHGRKFETHTDQDIH